MFLMSEGPSFEADSRCEMGVLCLSWCAHPSGIKNGKGCLARTSPSEQESKSLLGPCPEMEIFGKPFGSSSNLWCCLCALVHGSSPIVLPLSLLLELDVNPVLVLAGLCLLTLLVGNFSFLSSGLLSCLLSVSRCTVSLSIE